MSLAFTSLLQQKHFYLFSRQLHLSNILGYGPYTYFNIHKNVTDPKRQDPDYFEKEADKLPLGNQFINQLKNILEERIKIQLIWNSEYLLNINRSKFEYKEINKIKKIFNFVYFTSNNMKMESENGGANLNEEPLIEKNEEPKQQKSKKVEDLPLVFCDYIMLALLFTTALWPFSMVYNYVHYDWDKIFDDFIERKIEEEKKTTKRIYLKIF